MGANISLEEGSLRSRREMTDVENRIEIEWINQFGKRPICPIAPIVEGAVMAATGCSPFCSAGICCAASPSARCANERHDASTMAGLFVGSVGDAHQFPTFMIFSGAGWPTLLKLIFRYFPALFEDALEANGSAAPDFVLPARLADTAGVFQCEFTNLSN